MEVDTETDNQRDSQDTDSSDCVDEATSYNENLQKLVRENASIMQFETSLLNKLVNINYKNVNGDTALHLAVRKRNCDIVDFLIKRGADVAIVNSRNKTALKMVHERLERDPNDASLQSIEAFLRRAQAGTSRRRSSEEIDSFADLNDSTQSSTNNTSVNTSVNQPKKQKIDHTDTYDAHSLRSNFHGPIYQAKLLALFGKRALSNSYEFSLASEMDDAEALDDVVLRYKESNKWTWRFVQAKHKQNTDSSKITISELISNDNDFSLQKYFLSFCKIKYNERFKDATFKDFTLITNTEFEFNDCDERIASSRRVGKEFCELIKLWSKYFEEEKNLQVDPILHVEACMVQTKKFKFTQKAKEDLYEQFKSNLLESVSTLKEIDSFNAIKKKLRVTKHIKRKDQLERAKTLVIDIAIECKDKQRKGHVIKMAKEFVRSMEKFLNENGCKQSVDNLKESIKLLEKNRVGTGIARDSMQKIHSDVKEVEKVIDDCQEELEKYSDSCSEEYQDLEGDKVELFDDERELRKLRKEVSDSKDLEWIKKEINNKDILKRKYRIPKSIIDTIQKSNDLKQVKKTLYVKLQRIISNISMIKVALNDNTFEKCLDEFLEQFRIITNYPDEGQLSDVLQQEIGDKFSLLSADFVRDSFEREMINFLKEKRGRFYHGIEGEQFFEKMEQKINTFMCIGLCKAYTERLDAYGISLRIKFKEICKLSDFLSNDSEKVFHISTKFTRLVAIKLFRQLTDSGQFKKHDSYIFIRLGTVLHREETRKFILNAFNSGIQSVEELVEQSFEETVIYRNTYDLCVIECRQECRRYIGNLDVDVDAEQNLFKMILNILSKNPNKKLIIIAPDDDGLSKKFREHYEKMNSQTASDENLNEPLFIKIEDEIKFTHLDDNSRNKVLAKEIKFQEKDNMRFDQLIDKILACKIIDSENLLRLIENEEIQIGDEKAFSSIGYEKDFYIEREFNLKQKPTNDSSNISEKLLVERGNVQKLTLLVNNAGMGKSTVLTSVAKKMRQNKENAWIVRINLTDYGATKNTPHSLNRINFKELEIGKGIEFVSKMVIRRVRGKINDAKIRLQRALIKASLEKTESHYKKPPIVILLDGFDEISPNYNEKTSTLINTLKASDVSQLWITTRPHEKDHLQNELNSTSYYLQPLKDEEQIAFFDNFLKWHIRCGKPSVGSTEASDRSYPQMIKRLQEIKEASLTPALTENISNILKKNSKKGGKIDELKNEINSLSFTEYVKNNLLSLWREGVFAKDSNFYGTPLNLKMLTVVVSAEKQLISKLEPFDLYQKFVNIQFSIFYKIKAKSKPGNQAASDICGDHGEYLNNVHNSLAAQILFPKDYEEKLLPDLIVLDKLKQEIKQNEGKGEKVARVGLLNLRSEKLEFIHHSFAEFFFSKYLMNNLEHERVQQIFIENILFESAYGVIRQFINDQLKGSDVIIELTNASKNFIDLNSQKSSENNIRKILKNEKHLNIINFLKLDE
ncbi:uncharacterized protein LOC129576420 [Sitodiplosis mosellana]|uniref:uncharacterized protein LOC129576420 n=1 Tax=Sitodiplosis mosellana TaxID=263140 RepID=UPI002444F45B|nr:uncharacterized protein LOC129576420 [Sitodiplosis mosellana]XP_055317511.1 uncharacterized protein LOC129576420 [Sitodiplosis mosellana]